MTPMMSISGVYLRTLKHLTAASSYAPNTRVPVQTYRVLRKLVHYKRLCSFVIYCAQVMILPPLYLKNAMAALITSLFITYLAESTEESSLHVIMKCVVISSTLINEPSPLTVYAVKTSSTRGTSYQRRTYVRGGKDWIP